MKLILFVILFIFLGSFSFAYSPSPVFQPNFSAPVSFLPQGTAFTPFCSSYNMDACLRQWSSQAVLMSRQTPQQNQPAFTYYLPGFIGDSSPKSVDYDDWEEIELPKSSSTRRRTFFRNKNNSESIISVQKNEDTGEEIIEQGTVVLIDMESVELIEQESPSVEELDADGEGQGFEASTPLTDSIDPTQTGTEEKPETPVLTDPPDSIKEEFRQEFETPTQNDSSDSTKTETRQEPEISSLTANPYSLNNNQSRIRGSSVGSANKISTTTDSSVSNETETKQEPKTSSSTDSSVSANNQSDTSASSVSSVDNARQSSSSEVPAGQVASLPAEKRTTPQAQTSKGTIALPAEEAIKEIQPNCFVVNKQDTQTEAGANCATGNCLTKGEKDTSLLGNVLETIKDVIALAEREAQKRIKSKLGDGSYQEKICSPDISLLQIIKNFNKTCGKSFGDFFKEARCESCKKGIPSEVMMAMMSIESAGKCSAHNSNGENSAGLFQINADVHACKEDKNKDGKNDFRIISKGDVRCLEKTNCVDKNVKCLKDRDNNFQKALDVLADSYNETNSNEIEKPCKDWLSMKPTERDSFRRAVAGYNGGPGWITRAIKVGRGNDKRDTTKYGSQYRTDTMSWKELRRSLFIERLKTRKGRSTGNSISNLAHTEAVLGSELKGSTLGMVEVWSQYKKDFLRNPSNNLCK